MKWTRETKVYMWANYYSEDGNWKAWDEEEIVKGGGRKRYYDPDTKQFKKEDLIRHFWKLQDLRTGRVLEQEFKTLKAVKQFAEEQ